MYVSSINLQQAEDEVKAVDKEPRISTVSANPLDEGNVSGVTELTPKNDVIKARGMMTYGEYRKMKTDSMRSSVGVDLGGNYYQGKFDYILLCWMRFASLLKATYKTTNNPHPISILSFTYSYLV